MATTESFSRPTNLIEVNNIYTKYTFTVFILFYFPLSSLEEL